MQIIVRSYSNSFFAFFEIFFAVVLFIEKKHAVHTENMKMQWKKLLNEPQIKKSMITTGGFTVYLVNMIFFCCRAIHPYEKGYAPNDLQYLQDQLQCANPFAALIAILDGLILCLLIYTGIRYIQQHHHF